MAAATTEPHDRGAILVAAVFDAFLAIYKRRIRDLVRLATGGSGVLPDGDVHPDLVDRMADEAAKTSGHFLRILIRALDFCPPVDIGFGDYLRAMITADRDLVPDDPWGYRVALTAAFRRRGIHPGGVRSLAEENLLWGAPDGGALQVLQGSIFSEVDALRRACPDWGPGKSRQTAWEQSRALCALLTEWLYAERRRGAAVAAALGLTLSHRAPATVTRSARHPELPDLEVHSVRPAYRVAPDGSAKTDLLVELVQHRHGFLEAADQERHDRGAGPPQRSDFAFRGGATVLIDLETGAVRYVIAKGILSDDRLKRQRAFLASCQGRSLAATYFGSPERTFYAQGEGRGEPLALLHRSQPTGGGP